MITWMFGGLVVGGGKKEWTEIPPVQTTPGSQTLAVKLCLNIKQIKNFTSTYFYLRLVNCPVPSSFEAHTSYSWLSILYLCCLSVIGGRFFRFNDRKIYFFCCCADEKLAAHPVLFRCGSVASDPFLKFCHKERCCWMGWKGEECLKLKHKGKTLANTCQWAEMKPVNGFIWSDWESTLWASVIVLSLVSWDQERRQIFSICWRL